MIIVQEKKWLSVLYSSDMVAMSLQTSILTSKRRHSYPRSLAVLIVVWTQTSVVTPARMMLRIPLFLSMRSRLVATKLPFPGLSITTSVGRGASSGITEGEIRVENQYKIATVGTNRSKSRKLRLTLPASFPFDEDAPTRTL
jgi:hypothetical protein